MTTEKSSPTRKTILWRRHLVNISAENIQLEELRKSRIREESIVLPEKRHKTTQTVVKTEDPAAPWYFTHT